MTTRCALAIFAMLTASRPASAAQTMARLEYRDTTGLPGCPDETALKRGVSARLGRSPFTDTATRLVRVSLSPATPGLVGRVESIEGTRSIGEREVKTAVRDCAGVTEALLLAIALAIDPIAAMRPPPAPEPERAPPEPIVVVVAEPAPPPPPVPVPKPVVEVRPPPAPAPLPPRVDPPPPVRTGPERTMTGKYVVPPAADVPWQARVAGGLDLAFLAAPGIAPGLLAEVSFTDGAKSYGVEARWGSRGRVALGTGTVGVSTGSAAALSCYEPELMDVCALFGVGVQFADGDGLTTDRSGVAPLAFVGARAGLRVPLSAKLFLRVDATIIAPFTRLTLRVNDEAVWTSPSAAIFVGPRLGGELW